MDNYILKPVCVWVFVNSNFILKAGRNTGANTLYRTPLIIKKSRLVDAP